MMYKVLGSVLVILTCGGFGFSIAASHRKVVRLLNSFIAAISFMRCELQYRCTALPELCAKTAAMLPDMIGKFFRNLSNELESQICPDIKSCTMNALSKTEDIPVAIGDCIMTMANTLGCFDLNGQLEGLARAERQAQNVLEKLTFDLDKRLRSYQTLGLCAGTALAILLV